MRAPDLRMESRSGSVHSRQMFSSHLLACSSSRVRVNEMTGARLMSLCCSLVNLKPTFPNVRWLGASCHDVRFIKVQSAGIVHNSSEGQRKPSCIRQLMCFAD